MTFKTAVELLRNTRPELFARATPEELAAKDETLQKQETIKEEIAKLREAEPHLSFALAWNRLMQERPESFDFEEG